MLRSQGRETWGAKGERVPVNFEPVFRRLNKLRVCDQCHEADDASGLPMQTCISCGGNLRRVRLFADSNSDWLDPKWPVETLARFLDAIRLAPNVDVLLLTKRIELWPERMKEVRRFLALRQLSLSQWIYNWQFNTPPANVWLGVSVEDQQRADERCEVFRTTPAAVKFVSYEPALGYACWDGWEFVNQIIAGGESGKNRRPCELYWFEETAAFCERNRIAFHMKQDGSLLPGQRGRIPMRLWQRKEFPR